MSNRQLAPTLDDLQHQVDEHLATVEKLQAQLGTARLTVNGRKMATREWLKWREDTIKQLREEELLYRKAKRRLAAARKEAGE